MNKSIDYKLNPLSISARTLLLATSLSIAISATVQAETYRIVDEQGRVTYTDQPPPNASSDTNSSSVEKLPDNTENQNITPSLDALAEDHPEWLKEAHEQRAAEAKAAREAKQLELGEKRKEWREQFKAAKAAVKSAEIAFEVGKEPGEGDFVGNAGGGARPSSDYLMRLETLEKDLADAKRDLRRVKKSKPG